MTRKMFAAFGITAALTALGGCLCFAAPADPPTIAPATMPRVGTIDERFQSYNIEMVEVTGGRFWKPYASTAAPEKPSTNQPSGMDPSLYEYRPPIDLSNARLRKLASALGPAYLRVSGTWANSTYFQNSDAPPPTEPPPGFKGVLTRPQWKGVVDFSNAANAEIVTSFAVSAGARDSSGIWTPDQASQIVAYTESVGGKIAAAEYMNEPTFAVMGGAPNGYDAAAYGRDFAVFHAFARKSVPGMLILGPGGVGEGSSLVPASMHLLSTESLLLATGHGIDAFSYHSYGGVSSRCASMGAASTTSAAAALSAEWLARPIGIEEFYAKLRDQYEPGKPMWLTETAETACGGDRWASTFLDSFRYLDQLGLLAKLGVQVHLHNTLASSDYGLLDEKTYEPRPNYWAALLWHKLMGTTVLDPGASPSPNLHLYAQCLRNQPGGVALLAINADRTTAYSLAVPVAGERYTLTAKELMDKQVQLNDADLKLGADDSLPELQGTATKTGKLAFAPTSITFLALPMAHNASCQQ
jgi:heparanase 1